MKKLFKQLARDVAEARCLIPQHVSITKDPDEETSEQIIARQDRFISLPETIKDKLSDHATGQKIQQMGQFFNLELLQIADIARAIRSYYFGELKIEDMPFLLAKEIPIDFFKAKEITDLVIQKIINDNSQEIAYQEQLDHLLLSDALKQYPEIGEQLITTEKITLKNFPEPVRPSIKNWLADYSFNLDFGSHSAIERGNYLFHSPNTLRLSSSDREKLSYILKAYDEKTEVTVNKNTKQLVFPAAEQRHSVSTPQDQSKTPSVPYATTDSIPKARLFAPREATQVKPSFRGDQQQNAIQNPAYRPLSAEIQNPKSQFPNKSQIQNSNVRTEGLKQESQNYAQTRNNINFSSPQKLPYEKLKASPYVIRPVYSQPDEEKQEPRELPKNVVNLKDNF